MPTYSYTCARCGGFDLVLPMAQVAATGPCPGCGAAAPRRITAPALNRTNPALHRALDAQHRSADTPQVVTSPPPRRPGTGTRYSTDPRHLRLPLP